MVSMPPKKRPAEHLARGRDRRVDRHGHTRAAQGSGRRSWQGSCSPEQYWLGNCEGFWVQSQEGTVGIVEAVRFGSCIARPETLAVRTDPSGNSIVIIPVDGVDRILWRNETIVLGRPHAALGRGSLQGSPVTPTAQNAPAPSSDPVGVSLVHHAAAPLGDHGRHAIAEIAEGYGDVLRLHERRRVPLGLRFDGPLLEAVAEHRPQFLTLVRSLGRQGLLSLVGGPYHDTGARLSDAGLDSLELDRLLELYERHLDWPPDTVRICWLPAPLWGTWRAGALLSDVRLRNGGYRFALLDDGSVHAIGVSLCLEGRRNPAFLDAGGIRGDAVLVSSAELGAIAGVAGFPVALRRYDELLGRLGRRPQGATPTLPEASFATHRAASPRARDERPVGVAGCATGFDE